MIEQFRMARYLATRTKVIDTAHETFTKQLLPNAIDRYACCERITIVGEPICEL